MSCNSECLNEVKGANHLIGQAQAARSGIQIPARRRFGTKKVSLEEERGGGGIRLYQCNLVRTGMLHTKTIAASPNRQPNISVIDQCVLHPG
jgi:hypothetical protein